MENTPSRPHASPPFRLQPFESELHSNKVNREWSGDTAEQVLIKSIEPTVDFSSEIHSSEHEIEEKDPDVVDKWTCHICDENFSYNTVFILMHFRIHHPSTKQCAAVLSPRCKNKFFGKINTLGGISSKNRIFRRKASLGGDDAKNMRGASDRGRSRGLLKNTNERTASIPSPKIRKVAKKSCSGRPFEKTKMPKVQTSVSSEGQMRTVAKKSCSGYKPPKSNRILSETEKPRAFTPSKSEKSYISPENKKKKKRKELASLDRSSKTEPPRKKVKSTPEPPKKKPGKKAKKIYFPKPPKVASCSNLSNLMRGSMEDMDELMEKPNPSISELKKLMDVSFPYRKFRYENLVPIEQILSIFPALRFWEILKYEFEIFKRANFDELNYKLNRELEDQIEMAKNSLYSTKYPNSLVQKILDKHKYLFADKDLERDTKLLCYCIGLAGGKLEGTLYKQRGPEEMPFKSVTPTIDICGELGESDVKITVYCEETLITEAPNFYEAVMCSYAVYWIFNLCYEKTAKPFYEELDCLIGE